VKEIPMPHPHFTTEEIARRGAELYEQVRAALPAGVDGQYLALDIETGITRLDTTIERLRRGFTPGIRMPDSTPSRSALRLPGGSVCDGPAA
jgi:hypothetical protein